MLHMLDTNIAIYVIKDYAGSHVLGRLRELGLGEVCVSAITRAELLFGLKRVPLNHRLSVG